MRLTKIKITLFTPISKIIDFLINTYNIYKTLELRQSIGKIGDNSYIQFPCKIAGKENIYIEDNVSIGVNSIITAVNAKVIIKRYTFSAQYLHISTGDHMYIPGKFCKNVTNEDKLGSGLDLDVIINEDVWIASKVTILKGVVIGRGSIIGAGSVVTKNIIPYSINGGVPAKFIKFKWDIETIMEHEKILYPIEYRFTKVELEAFLINSKIC